MVSTTTVYVRFAPTAAGPQAGTLIINSNASNQSAFRISLAGSGIASGAVELKVDDGGYEAKVGYVTGGAYTFFVNRLTPPAYPATLKTVRISFHSNSGGLDAAAPIWVLAGANSTGSANIDKLMRALATVGSGGGGGH